jgi:hypothetical protein
MVQRRRRSFGSGLVLSVLATLMLMFVAIPGSVARAADDTEAPPDTKTEYKPQADDEDRPHDKSLLEKTPADAAVASKAQAGEEPAFYQRWQFWAITGAIVVGAVAAVWGGATLYHTIHGGDVRPCNKTFLTCAGQGEPQ